jgi:hypothetical protein
MLRSILKSKVIKNHHQNQGFQEAMFVLAKLVFIYPVPLLRESPGRQHHQMLTK